MNPGWRATLVNIKAVEKEAGSSAPRVFGGRAKRLRSVFHRPQVLAPGYSHLH